MKTYSDYMDGSKELFKLLFGEETFERLNSIPLKSVSWEGLDIDTCEILATFPNIKERFSPKWIEYFEENGNVTLLDLFLQAVFHYGYQQCYDANEGTRRIIEMLSNHKIIETLEKWKK